MRAILARSKGDDKQTLGNLFVIENDGDILYQCKTLELAWKNNQKRISCIPKGTYTVIARESAKYGNHWHITNVEGRSYILIHHGNYHSDILGCVLVGASHTDIDGDGYRDVTSSKNTMKKLQGILPDKFEIEII